MSKMYEIKGTDLAISRMALGCASLGGWSPEGIDAETQRTADRLVHAARDAGITLFDMADFYGNGNAEVAFGEVLKASPSLRDRIVIQSKCGQITPGLPGYRVDLSRDHIVASVEQSLRRLHTDRLDILLLHAPDALMEPAEVGEALAQLKKDGKVRHFGVSNFSAAQIEKLKRGIDERLLFNQIQLGLAHPYALMDGMEFVIEVGQDAPKIRTGEKAAFTNSYVAPSSPGTFDYCVLNDIQIQAFSPVRGDLLDPASAPTPQARKAAELVAEIAAKKGVSPAAVALAWLLRHPSGIVPIFWSTKAERIAANCAAETVELDRTEWYALFTASARLTYLPVG